MITTTQHPTTDRRAWILERTALALLGRRNTEAHRRWLSAAVPFQILATPRLHRIYRHRDIIDLRENGISPP